MKMYFCKLLIKTTLPILLKYNNCCNNIFDLPLIFNNKKTAKKDFNTKMLQQLQQAKQSNEIRLFFEILLFKGTEYVDMLILQNKYM